MFLILFAASLPGALPARGSPAATAADGAIPMVKKGARTFYVHGDIGGLGSVELLVDTGAGYMTINQVALKRLRRTGNAKYVKDLTGIMADGSRRVVPIYRLTSITLGGRCTLHDVDAAVFPQRTRLILGLSALEKAAPFTFSTDPPELTLSNCIAPGTAAAGPHPGAGEVSSGAGFQGPGLKASMVADTR